MVQSRTYPAMAPVAAEMTSASDIAISLSRLRVVLGGAVILDDVSADVEAGEIVVLIGPSGCGKSTLLNAVAGALKPASGSVECLGAKVSGLNRRVAYVTQRDTLLPWRSALRNAALPLEIKGVPKEERLARAAAALERVGIGQAAQRRPNQLSGGMRSRLALARMLLTESEIVLMDEPFAAIDALLKVRLQQLLVDVWAESPKTMLYVTHDLNEAIALGHRIVVMGQGTIQAVREVPAPHPRNVAEFRTSAIAESLNRDLWQLLTSATAGLE